MSREDLRPGSLEIRNFLPSINIDYPALRLSGPSPLDHLGTMKKSTSLHNGSPHPPTIRLPPISKSDLEERKQNRTLSRFAHSYQGLLYRSKLSTSLPDLRPPRGTMKYEKISYSKCIQEDPTQDLEPADAHATDFITGRHLQHKKRPDHLRSIDRKYETDILNIVNTTNRTVQYYEHDGQVYISDSNQSWKDDCSCKLCRKNKKDYFNAKRKLDERRQRKMKNSVMLRERHNSPLKEMKDE